MSDDKHTKDNDGLDNIIPYETLKASLDEATAEMIAAAAAFLETVQRQDPPLFIKIALHNFEAAYAKATARSNAVVSEYGHLAGVTQNIKKQRDEINSRYESMKKTLRHLKQLNLDDQADQNNQNNKDKKRRK